MGAAILQYLPPRGYLAPFAASAAKLRIGSIRAFSLPLLFICSCYLNPYTRFYTDLLSGTPVEQTPGLLATKDALMYETRDMNASVEEFLESGYALIGYTQFNGTDAADGLAQQAKRIGASAAILQTKYSHTRTGMTTVTSPTVSTSRTTHTGTIYSGTGSAYYTGTARTTTTSYQRHYVPYSIDRYDYVATFWAKRSAPPVLGVIMSELTTQQRQEYERNTGVHVDVVIRNSPAYRADIVPGDIIIALNGSPIHNCTHLQSQTNLRAGSEVTITVLRKSGEKTLKAQLNSLVATPAPLLQP